MPAPNGSNVILRVRHRSSSCFRSSRPLFPSPEGIAIGTASIAAFECNQDPLVAPEHGTLDCTWKYGIWVYIDHSITGTVVNQKRRVHRDAIVVSHGDRLLVGDTEIELLFEDAHNRGAQVVSPRKQLRRPNSGNSSNHNNQNDVESTDSSDASPRAARNVSMSTRVPAIVTAGVNFVAGTPEYIDSPVAMASSRRKRHSMSSSDLSTTLSQRTQARASDKLIPSAPSTPPRQDTSRPSTTAPSKGFSYHRRLRSEGEEVVMPASLTRPPPLEYSSSPVTAPSVLGRIDPSSPLSGAARPSTVPHLQLNAIQEQNVPAPKSRRDDLRIQVSKKMAGFAKPEYKAGANNPATPGLAGGIHANAQQQLRQRTSVGTAQPSKLSNQLDFTPPASPVAHQDILRQKQSLLNILKNKYREEQHLKEQQEEWMRQLMHNTKRPMGSPIISPSNSTGGKSMLADIDNQVQIPARPPVLMRTASLGPYQPSARLTAAVLASRARQNSLDGKPPAQVAPVRLSLRQSSVYSSVASSASTEITNHRRVTRSLSVRSSAS
ncbi:TPA: hypothetical protein N0F65_010575 [Lagenidium giganteum]|uniref:FHA domain-containing protein n=1 Tax=Lagenidium giganteum TaxID=4803 RepID=A0AAV2ZAX3_9STRA|nr:TPA: hypothetical protein N0F65_010575 [Lagenidium giganteum]